MNVISTKHKDKLTMKSLIEHVSDVYLEPCTSKNGNPYHKLFIKFDSGYTIFKAVFGDTEYILKALLEKDS